MPYNSRVANHILQTKLYIPPTRTSLVTRQRLLRKLHDGLNRKLTLVSAPAGFGKTTIVIDWLSATQRPVAWISLDEEDSEMRQLFSYIAAALAPHLDPANALSELLQAPQLPPAKTIAAALIQDLTSLAHPLILVLDDFHFIHSANIADALSYLVTHLPPQLHLVIISRADPALPLSRLRARQQMTELRAADLRMTHSETATFLNDLMQLNLTATEVSALENRTEGWAAGLQLAALSLENLTGEAKQSFVTAFSGDDRYILDYLLDEVLRQQSAELQTFLLKTAVLERLTAPLCDFLLESEHPQSQNTLQELERTNLFLIPLDHTRQWYRYHHLFGDLLYSQLQALHHDDIPQLHKQASRWFEENGAANGENNALHSAFSHAWHSQDFDYAIALLHRHARRLLVQAELVTLTTWLGKLPRERLAAEPQLCLYYAWASTTILQLDTAESALQLLEQYLKSAVLSPAETADWQGQLTAVRALLVSKQLDIPQMVTLSQQALTLLAPDNHLLRGLAIANLASAQWFAGETAAACQALEAAIGANHTAGNITETLNLYGILAQTTFEMGELHRTEQICRQALQLIHNFDGNLPSAGFIYIQLGQLYREWNRLSEAAEVLQTGINVSQKESIGNLLMLRLLLAVVQREQGDEAGALAEIDKVQQLSNTLLLPTIAEQAFDILAFIHLQQRNSAAVQQWITTTGIHPTDTPHHFHEPRYLILAQYLIEQARFTEAEQLLQQLQTTLTASSRTGRLIQTLILFAVSYQQQNQPKKAQNTLQQAIGLAEPAGYIRTFHTAAVTLTPLLHQLPPTPYTQTLIASLPNPKSKIQNLNAKLPDPLTDRETELLQLIAHGYSNRQIAAELTLAIGTVKKHVSNIFSKLHVTSRTQAIARARELGIL